MIELKMVHKSKMLVQITLHMSVGQYLRYHNNEACNHFVYEPPPFFFSGERGCIICSQHGRPCLNQGHRHRPKRQTQVEMPQEAEMSWFMIRLQLLGHHKTKTEQENQISGSVSGELMINLGILGYGLPIVVTFHGCSLQSTSRCHKDKVCVCVYVYDMHPWVFKNIIQQKTMDFRFNQKQDIEIRAPALSHITPPKVTSGIKKSHHFNTNPLATRLQQHAQK